MNVQTVTTYQAVLGAIISKLRVERGLKQSDLADVIGISASAFSRLEKGDSSLTTEQLRLIAKCMGISPGRVMDLAEEATDALPKTTGVTVQAMDREVWAAGAGAMVGAGLLPIAGAALGALVGNFLKSKLARDEKAPGSTENIC